MKQVTIATDISCDPPSGLTTWSCYIKHDKGEIKFTDEFKKNYKSTVLAETHALLNALTIAYKRVPDWQDSEITIYHEIDYVLKPCLNECGNVRKAHIDRWEDVKRVGLPILEKALKWEKKDVKAHYSTRRPDSHEEKYIMNRWCDKNSKKAMKKIRDKKVLAIEEFFRYN